MEHGPSLVPDEPETTENVLVEAVVADPSGFPLLLHQCAEAECACLSGARLSVHEWKKSQEWCAPPRHSGGSRAQPRLLLRARARSLALACSRPRSV